jgi:hypothetical protein
LNESAAQPKFKKLLDAVEEIGGKGERFGCGGWI